MNGLDVLTIVLAVLVLAVAIFGIIWHFGGFRKRGFVREAPMMRGRSLLIYRGQWMRVEKEEEAGDTVRRLHLRDGEGNQLRKTFAPEEIRMHDIWQVLCGPGEPIFEYVPSERRIAAELAAREADSASRIALKDARERADDAQSEKKLAQAETQYETRDQIERAVQVAKAAMSASKGRPKGGN